MRQKCKTRGSARARGTNCDCPHACMMLWSIPCIRASCAPVQPSLHTVHTCAVQRTLYGRPGVPACLPAQGQCDNNISTQRANAASTSTTGRPACRVCYCVPVIALIAVHNGQKAASVQPRAPVPVGGAGEAWHGTVAVPRCPCPCPTDSLGATLKALCLFEGPNATSLGRVHPW